MVKIITAALIHAFRLVMDPRISPLRHLPAAQRFQVMCILGTMWTTIFCLGTGAWVYYGELVVLHLLLPLGTLVTAGTFFSASRTPQAYGAIPVTDRTTRHDVVQAGWVAAEAKR